MITAYFFFYGALFRLEQREVEGLDSDVCLVFSVGNAVDARMGDVDADVLIKMRIRSRSLGSFAPHCSTSQNCN